jgi:hypothetical protein
MELVHSYKSVDDGYFKLFKTDCNIKYKDVYDDINKYVYKCDGLSINSRNIGLFTLDKDKIGKPFCLKWKHTPNRYIYQPFTPMLEKLHSIIMPLYDNHDLTDAIVNVYDEGDFITYHKDYHSVEREPCSIVFSFEYDETEHHIMEFYRTTGEDWSMKKDKSKNREEFSIILPNHSISVMVGLQRKYAHSIKPGRKRISVVFR